MKSKIFFRICFILWICLILFLTSYPKLSIPTNNLLGVDKIGHFGAYFGLALLFNLMQIDRDYKQTRNLLLRIMFIMPVLDELHQIPIPGRSFSFFDILADLLGFFIIILIFNQQKIRSAIKGALQKLD